MKALYTLGDLEKEPEPALRLGVVGHPVAHSLSPEMENAALSACEISLHYARFEIARNELGAALKLFAQHEFIGLNVTAPHKSAVVRFLGQIYEPASAIGA